MEECCLCSHSVGTGSWKKKRKKLYGIGCLASRSVLERLADELAGEGGPKRFVEVKGPHAFLCHACEGKLQSIARHEEQLRALRAEINTQLQSVLSSTEKEIPGSVGHKRCSEDTGTSAPSRKAPRLDPQPWLPGQGQPACLELPSSSEEPPSVVHEQSPSGQNQPTSLQQSPASYGVCCMVANVNIVICACAITLLNLIDIGYHSVPIWT